MNSHGAHRFLSFHTIKAATAPPLRIAGMRYVYSIMQTNYQDYQYKSRSRPPSLPRPENDIENIVYRHSDTNHAKNGFRDRHATTGSCYAATLDPHEKPPAPMPMQLAMIQYLIVICTPHISIIEAYHDHKFSSLFFGGP